jgi:hypothetical protein
MLIWIRDYHLLFCDKCGTSYHYVYSSFILYIPPVICYTESVDVNIKDDCGNTPLIAVCQQTTVQNEEEAVKFVFYIL